MSEYQARKALHSGAIPDLILVITFPVVLLIAITASVVEGEIYTLLLPVFWLVIIIYNFRQRANLSNSSYQINNGILTISGYEINKNVSLNKVKSIYLNYKPSEKVLFETSCRGTSFHMGDSEDYFDSEKALFYLCTTEYENVLLLETFDEDKNIRILYGITPENEEELIQEIKNIVNVNVNIISNKK